MSEEPKRKGVTDFILAFAGVLVPLVLIYLGHIYKDTEAMQGIHEKYVEMSINILREPYDPQKKELRKWAVKVLNKYSEVPIHNEAQDHILNTSLPQIKTSIQADPDDPE